MDAITCIKERRSIRNFEDKKVPREVIEQVVETAAFAPSWKNTQIARYIVIEDQKLIETIANDCVLGFESNAVAIKKAPALVLVTMIKKRSGYERDGSFTTSKGDGWEMFDAGIAAQTFCLAAHEQGLGTVIMGIFDEAKVAEVVEIPEGQQLAAMIPLGYPSEAPKAPKRKTVEDLLSYR